MNKLKINLFTTIVLFVSVISCIFDFVCFSANGTVMQYLKNTIYYLMTFLFVIDVVYRFSEKSILSFKLIDIFFIAFFLIYIIFYHKNLTTFNYVQSQIITSIIIFLRCLLVVVLGIVKSVSTPFLFNGFKKKALNNPAKTVLLSYLYLIFLGTFLLLLPFSVYKDKTLDFVDAFFIASSSVSITGLTSVDVSTTFSIFGKIVIIVLVQIGGLGILLVSYFFGHVLLRRKLNYNQKINFNTDANRAETATVGKSIIYLMCYVFGIELIGAIILFFDFLPIFGFTRKNVFFSIFHAITGFCNEGFTLFDDNLTGFISNVPINLTIAGLIICGSLGFPVMQELAIHFKMFFIRRILRKDVQYKTFSVNTLIVLSIFGLLLLFSFFAFYAFEHTNVLKDLDIKTQYLSSFFQAVMLRTAGFNTLDIGSLRMSTLFMMILMMFIGGASGSMAGGIKVNTLGVILVAMHSFLHGKSDNIVLHKSINSNLIMRAFFVFFFSQIVIVVSFIVLSLTENFGFMELLFEVVSAFSTTGASMGITPYLSSFGKYLIVALMIIGKIGPMTMLMLLSVQDSKNNIKYPEVKMMIG